MEDLKLLYLDEELIEGTAMFRSKKPGERDLRKREGRTTSGRRTHSGERSSKKDGERDI